MADDTDRKKKWSWWLKLLLWLSPVFLLLVAGWLFDISGRKAWRRSMQEARQAGGPVTLEELQAARKVWPDDQNGALLIEPLLPWLTQIHEARAKDLKTLPIVGEADLPPLGQRWSDETDRLVAQKLEAWSDQLATIDRLKDYPGGRFPLPTPPNALDWFFPNLWPLIGSVKLKGLEVVYRASHGNTSSLVDDVVVMLRHGQLLENEPILISALAANATDRLTIQTIEQVCGLITLEPAQLDQLEQMLVALENNDRFYWSLLGERAFFIGATNDVLAGGSWADMPFDLSKLSGLPGIQGWLKRDQVVGIGLYNRIIRVAQDRREAARVAREVEVETGRLPSYYVLTRMLVPSIERYCELSLQSVAQVRTGRTALAVERYRIDTGRFPDRLDQLVPKYLDNVPADPFDDQPLRYRQDDDRAVIYSVSSNLTDDGGDVRYWLREQGGHPQDCGFTLLPPSARGQPPAEQPPATQTAPTTRGE